LQALFQISPEAAVRKGRCSKQILDDETIAAIFQLVVKSESMIDGTEYVSPAFTSHLPVPETYGSVEGQHQTVSTGEPVNEPLPNFASMSDKQRPSCNPDKAVSRTRRHGSDSSLSTSARIPMQLEKSSMGGDSLPLKRLHFSTILHRLNQQVFYDESLIKMKNGQDSLMWHFDSSPAGHLKAMQNTSSQWRNISPGSMRRDLHFAQWKPD
jgi:hypothetical protein